MLQVAQQAWMGAADLVLSESTAVVFAFAGDRAGNRVWYKHLWHSLLQVSQLFPDVWVLVEQQRGDGDRQQQEMEDLAQLELGLTSLPIVCEGARPRLNVFTRS